jgi:hypothetical protein
MLLDLSAITVSGPALPSGFIRHGFEEWLKHERQLALLRVDPLTPGYAEWITCLCDSEGSSERVLTALSTWLQYEAVESGEIATVDGGREATGFRLSCADQTEGLRVWLLPHESELHLPPSGAAYRFRPLATAERILQHFGERLGLITNGREFRVTIVEASGHQSTVSLAVPRSAIDLSHAQIDGLRLVRFLCGPAGAAALASLLDAARAWRRRLMRTLRGNTRRSIEHFVQSLLDAPENTARLSALAARETLAQDLFRESLVLAYRLLLVSMAASGKDAEWLHSLEARSRLAPEGAIGNHHTTTASPLSRRLVAKLLERVHAGHLGLPDRAYPWVREVFDANATPTLETLASSEQALAAFIDTLLGRAASALPGTLNDHESPARLYVEDLDIEDLGHVYEGLLEFEPGIAREPMCRLRGAKLEVVLPLARGQEYRTPVTTAAHQTSTARARSARWQRGAVNYIEELPPNTFYLRVGLGRKTAGSYYTPKAFVRFLVRETLRPQLNAKSPLADPNPDAILSIRVIDPTMGSGHFLIEACRYLGEALFEAALRCVELEALASAEAESTHDRTVRSRLERRARDLAARKQCVEPFLQARQGRLTLPTRLTRTELLTTLHACFGLIADQCLYGVDKDDVAVALARVALKLVSGGCATQRSLDSHLLAGNSLTGPTLDHMRDLPGTAQSAAGRGSALEQAVTKLLAEQLPLAVQQRSWAEHQLSTGDDPLLPQKQLASAYTGGVMLGSPAVNEAYAALAWSMIGGPNAHSSDSTPILREMLAFGRNAVAFELEFPEVFFPTGELARRAGFDAVIGNPPWDAIKFNTKEFLATFDLRVLEAPTKRERDEVESKLTQAPEVASQFAAYKDQFARFKRTNDRFFAHQKLTIDGDLAGRQLDCYRLVIERACQILAPDGYMGLVVPSSFHTAAGAAGVRRLLTDPLRLLKYVSFVNDLKFFDIAAGIEFGLLVAAGPAAPHTPTSARFRLRDPDALASPTRLGLLDYPIDRLCGANPYLTFPTLENADELEALTTCRSQLQPFSRLEELSGVQLRSTPTSVHMTHEAKHFVASNGWVATAPPSPDVTLHEGATFGRYTDIWTETPRLAVRHSRVAANERWCTLNGHYKLALRAIVGNSKEKCVCALLPPRCLVANSALVEGFPERRSNAAALMMVALLNSSIFSWLLGFYADFNVNLFALRYLPTPPWAFIPIIAHHALRLSANHDGFRQLWQEQLGEVWRESQPSLHWPAVCAPEQRRRLQAINDAIIARSYTLCRKQYARVLESMGHMSKTSFGQECLKAFDELDQLGLETFCREHDPYWDVPLVTALPKGLSFEVMPDAATALDRQ